jgi:membrane-bound lytic murein transglycosylase D
MWRLHTALILLGLALTVATASASAYALKPDSVAPQRTRSGAVFPDEFSDLDETGKGAEARWDDEVIDRLERARQRYLKALTLVEQRDTVKAADEFEQAIVLLNELASYPRIDENPDFTDLVQAVIEDYEAYVQNIDNVSENTSIFILRDKLFEEVDKAATKVETIQVAMPEPPSNVPPTTIPLTYNEYVQRNITFLTTRGRKFYKNWLARSGKWFPMLKRIAAEEDMPEEIVYLAMMESGLNPIVVSRAKAVGMWQFMQPTGEEYNLDVTFWMDERRDPEKATRAAMQFLKDLYSDLGDWHLALAAYNCGAGGVKRAKRKSGVENGTFWQIREQLPRETRDYVPLYIATALITMNREQYGFGEDSVAMLPAYSYDVVTITEPIAIHAAARCADIPVDSLKGLNTELVRNCTPPGREYKLKVPVGTAQSFTRRFTALTDDEKRPWVMHTVARGETVNAIARKYGVSTTDIASVNNISGFNAKLRRGTTLRIPVVTAANTTFIPNPESMQPVVASSVPMPPPTVGTPKVATTIHVVQSGESLHSIARRYGTRLADVRNWNNLPYGRDNIRIGDSLVVSATSQEPQQTAVAVERITIERPVQHTVVRGESMASIATLYGTTVEKIASTNNIRRTTKLQAGKKILVPTSLPKSEVAAIERSTPSGKPVTHKVQRGETLSSIAAAHNVSERDLRRWNADVIEGSTVFAGTRLAVYGTNGSATTAKGSSSQTASAIPKTYTVRRGDTMADIASRFGVSIEQLRKRNKALRTTDIVRTGQKIRLQ